MNKIFGIFGNNIINNDFYKNLFDNNKIISSYNYFLNSNQNEPFIKYDCQDKYIIIYNGYLTNKKELKCKLRTLGYQFKTDLDEEIIIDAYIYYKENAFNYLKGYYSFAIIGNNKIILVRDKIGGKSLFYTNNDYLIFSNEIKTLLNSKLVEPIVNDEGLKELFALGPSSTPSLTPFKDIKKLNPGEYLIYENNEINIEKYYKLPILRYNKSFIEAKNEVKLLIDNSINNLIKDIDKYGALLSGGLDSSIISKLISNNKIINTYFLSYKNNDIYFKSNDFQKELDLKYSLLMKDNISSNHKILEINEDNLFNNLINSMIARDLPGMGDIDSSLYWLLKNIDEKYIFTGECSDEIFGGYPWFYNVNNDNYPWIRNINAKQELLNDNYQYLNLNKYLNESYNKLLINFEDSIYDDKNQKEWRKITYINIYSFMQQLIYRLESISNAINKECISPFLDIDLIEFIYNLPYQYIIYNNEKKGILKEIYKDILPKEIIYRSKNPYPKTYSPIHKNMVINKIEEYLDNPKSSINKFFDKDKILKIISNDDDQPYYGQLMTNIQFLSYLIQFEEWVKIYNIQFEK